MPFEILVTKIYIFPAAKSAMLLLLIFQLIVLASKIQFDDYKARILFFVNLDIFDQTYSYKFALEHNYLPERTDF